MENNHDSPTPGAAIGSFIVIAVLIAGAVYVLGGQLFKKSTGPETDTKFEANSTLAEDEYLDLITASSTDEVPLSEEEVKAI